MPPNAIAWILRNSKRPWQRSFPPNEIKRRKVRQSRRAEKRRHKPSTLSFWRSASLHSAIFWDRRPALRCQRCTTPTVEASFLERTMVNRYLPLLSDPCLPRKLLPNQLRDFGLRVAFYWRHRLRVGRPRSSSLSQATEFDKLHPMISLEEFRAKRLGLVLMGGGAKGAYQIGAWRALWSSGVRHFSVIAGTSVGALNAVLIGKGSPRFAETVWFKVIDNQVLQGKADVSKR